VDKSIDGIKNFVIGALKVDYHFINCNLYRDVKVDKFVDIKMVVEGDSCPNCENVLKSTTGIEMGHIFKLGTKYSSKLETYFINEKGKQVPFTMGCYGWGVSRSVAGIVEQLHDENGILWPISVAPYTLLITVVNMKDEQQVARGEELYKFFKKKGVDVIIDDRKASPGFKFKDADLIGFPIRITVGRGIKDGVIEMKTRLEKKSKNVEFDDKFEKIYSEFEDMKGRYVPGI